MMNRFNIQTMSIAICMTAFLCILISTTTSTAQSNQDNNETSMTAQKRTSREVMVSPEVSSGIRAKPMDLDSAAGEKKYKLVKKKPKHKKIKMEVYEPKMKYKKIKMKIPVKKMKKKKVKGYMVKKKKHYY